MIEELRKTFHPQSLKTFPIETEFSPKCQPRNLDNLMKLSGGPVIHSVNVPRDQQNGLSDRFMTDMRPVKFPSLPQIPNFLSALMNRQSRVLKGVTERRRTEGALLSYLPPFISRIFSLSFHPFFMTNVFRPKIRQRSLQALALDNLKVGGSRETINVKIKMIIPFPPQSSLNSSFCCSLGVRQGERNFHQTPAK